MIPSTPRKKELMNGHHLSDPKVMISLGGSSNITFTNATCD